MATLTKSKESVLTELVEPLLNPYEEFTISADYPGVHGYVLHFRTNTYIHRKHTPKALFIPHSVYNASTTTALPSVGFIEALLKNTRIAAKNFLDKGDYTGEEIISGEWQSVKRKYNQWIYYDRKNQRLIGKVHICPK